jgi:carboxypeptidase C (cathepsin A)
VNNRWQAPKYLLGESYGGIRGSLLAHHLQSDFNIAIKGVVFISPALSDTTADFSGDDNNVAWWTFFPNYATTAWFHKKIAAKYQNMTVDQVYNLAQQFANTKLRDALDQGDLLDPAVFDSTAQDVADFVGLPKARIAQLNLRVSPENMFLEELSSAGLGIGRYDSRFTAPFVPGTNFDDPSGTATGYPFTADINEYLRTELNFPQAQSPYNVFGQITSWPDEGGQTDVMTDISLALATNPNMKIMIASGYFDLACPMGTVAYELAQMPDGAKLGSRIVQKRYFGGHMMYINPAALQQLKTDIAQFMTTP